MQRWFDYVQAHSVDGLLEPWPDTEYRTWYLGDWATPPGVDQTAPESIGVVTNCVVSESLGLMTKIARILGREQDADRYAAWKRETDRLIHATFFAADSQSYASGSQIDQIYPMLVGATPAEMLPPVEESLIRETFENRDGHLATGLVGIPVMVDWAVRNRRVDFMYDMLKKRDFPGYLYMIDQGATATWEHWNGSRSRVHNCFNGIGSWFYQAIGGLRHDGDTPGWRHSVIDIQIPSEGVTWARTAKETPYGTLALDWKLEGKTISAQVTIPPGCTSKVEFPAGTTEYILNGRPQSAAAILTSGDHSLSYDLP
jgi:alpha-L-rhamnosidase